MGFVLEECEPRSLDLVLVPAWCTKVLKADGQSVLKQIGFDKVDFPHLKRIRSVSSTHLEVMVGVAPHDTLACYEVQVAGCIPRSPEELLLWKQTPGLWPISYTPRPVTLPTNPSVEMQLEFSSILSETCSAAVVDPTTMTVLAKAVGDSSHPLKHPAMELLDRLSGSLIRSRGGYLCNGLDIVLEKEPCLMCAMACLHSRVRRIWYKNPNIKFGALGSKFNLHLDSRLNHKFEVYIFD